MFKNYYYTLEDNMFLHRILLHHCALMGREDKCRRYKNTTTVCPKGAGSTVGIISYSIKPFK